MSLRRLFAVLLLAIPRVAYGVPIVVADNISSTAVVSNVDSVGVLGPATTRIQRGRRRNEFDRIGLF